MTIIKIIVSGFFVYVISPALLAIRDILLLKVIEKFIITDELFFNIKLCESDRWQLNNKFSFSREVGIPLASGESVLKIGDKKVSIKEFHDYEENLNFHQVRFDKLNAKINMRHNLIFWLTKHYKTDELKSPIPKLREEAYERAEKQNS